MLAATGGSATVHTVTVGQSGDMFSPSTITIAVGDSVHWVWMDDNHTVTSGTNGAADSKFCSPSDTNCSNPQVSNTGATYDHTFAAAGTFPYFCTEHSADGMTGSVVVQ